MRYPDSIDTKQGAQRDTMYLDTIDAKQGAQKDKVDKYFTGRTEG